MPDLDWHDDATGYFRYQSRSIGADDNGRLMVLVNYSFFNALANSSSYGAHHARVVVDP